MIAPLRTQPSSEVKPLVRNDEQDRFVQLLPRIHGQARRAFRHLRLDLKEELVAETVATAFELFLRLVRRGKLDLVYATPLAQFAIRRVRSGRCLVRRSDARDVMSARARAEYGIVIERLETRNRSGEWCEQLVENRRSTPADVAAARLDIAAWFELLTPRNRGIALLLALGEAPMHVSRRFRVSRGRISQIRAGLAASWEKFQGGSENGTGMH